MRHMAAGGADSTSSGRFWYHLAAPLLRAALQSNQSSVADGCATALPNATALAAVPAGRPRCRLRAGEFCGHTAVQGRSPRPVSSLASSSSRAAAACRRPTQALPLTLFFIACPGRSRPCCYASHKLFRRPSCTGSAARLPLGLPRRHGAGRRGAAVGQCAIGPQHPHDTARLGMAADGALAAGRRCCGYERECAAGCGATYAAWR